MYLIKEHLMWNAPSVSQCTAIGLVQRAGVGAPAPLCLMTWQFASQLQVACVSVSALARGDSVEPGLS